MPNKKILIISFFSSRTGCSPAVWLDDKIDSCLKLGYSITLVSSLFSKKVLHKKVKHFRLPSLSYLDLKIEFLETRQLPGGIPWTFWLWSPLFIFSHLFDLIFVRLTGGHGGSKISWSISSFITSFILALLNRPSVIFSTGGPASSHISASLVSRILRIPLVIELQDPLVGHGIGRNSKSAKMLSILEAFLIKSADKVVYVTKQAAAESNARYKSDNIVGIYPGARRFPLSTDASKHNKIRIIHLGTLYSSRNLDSLIAAIHNLKLSQNFDTNLLEIVNLGEIYLSNSDDYSKLPYFKKLPIMEREAAIKYASECDICLIVQHSDQRSTTTIPYKTYDYFNINKPIWGLTNSDELKELLISHGHVVSDINSQSEIENTLLFLIRNKGKLDNNLICIDPVEQTAKILDLSSGK